MRPLLSVIIPVYNVEKYINKCINSILKQNYDNFEILLINDGSSDKSGEICNQYLNIDERIKVFHKKNGGVSSARNLGLKNAVGDLLTFIDSDDWISENMFSEMINLLKEHDADFIQCEMIIHTRNKGTKFYNYNIKSQMLSKDEAFRELYKNKMINYSVSNKIYKRELFSSIQFREDIIFEDMDISYKILEKCTQIYYCSKAFYNYNYNPASILRKPFSLKRLIEFDIQKDLFKYYEEHYPEISDIVYYNVAFIGSKLSAQAYKINRLIKKDLSYLINYDKSILKRNLKNKNLSFKKKILIILMLYIPKTDVFLKRIFLKVRELISINYK